MLRVSRGWKGIRMIMEWRRGYIKNIGVIRWKWERWER